VQSRESDARAAAEAAARLADAEDIAYTREVLIPYLDAEHMRTCIECLFGDAVARTLGFTPQGLSPWAGLALALHDARSDPTLRAENPTRRGQFGSRRRARRSD
jgi:hypothetical protein